VKLRAATAQQDLATEREKIASLQQQTSDNFGVISLLKSQLEQTPTIQTRPEGNDEEDVVMAPNETTMMHRRQLKRTLNSVALSPIKKSCFEEVTPVLGSVEFPLIIDGDDHDRPQFRDVQNGDKTWHGFDEVTNLVLDVETDTEIPPLPIPTTSNNQKQIGQANAFTFPISLSQSSSFGQLHCRNGSHKGGDLLAGSMERWWRISSSAGQGARVSWTRIGIQLDRSQLRNSGGKVGTPPREVKHK
jgi:hypothetical protein